MPVSTPSSRGGALLIHGLTDSPYSLRSTAEILHHRGYHWWGFVCRATAPRRWPSDRPRSRIGGLR